MGKTRKNRKEQHLLEVADKLAALMDGLMEAAGDKMDAKDMKTLAGAIKDLRQVHEQKEDAAPSEITVRFEGGEEYGA